MSNILSDCQQSLAAAIARLEIQRLRIEKLKNENVHLRDVLRAHNINPGEAAVAAAADAGAGTKAERDVKHDAQQAEALEPITLPTEQQPTEQQNDSHNVLLHTRVENTAVKVRPSHNCLYMR
jgi:ribosomal protein L12E/L44/L45/RPP1/RPP2